ncbi:MAG TPA: energy-coupling factor transporter ATPase [Candidatus Ventrousia excrementavium]|uniref:Energy-coupling factor transporter ATP-binding protein EcfA2 n=1 Tax=Candidatus Ventrousia excrementavium TaxID=2840961 RepID=A0A9D1LJH3_9CLOT|nr:energy-coupling factor transporter ATPase [Candidatus Ventrousia excrementavium]
MSEVLKVENLSHIYSAGTPFEKVAIENVTFAAQKGEIIGLIGHTGSGKSTLIQHFNGLLKPTSGRVLINGEDIHQSREMTRAARFAVGLVFQYPEYQLFEETVRRDVAFGPKNMGLEQDEIDRRVEEAVRIVGLPPEVLEASPFELSGGQKRRVALAGVFAMEPEVLVLDEPMAGLDPVGREEVFRFITGYQRKHGTTVIFVTHSMEDAARMAQRIVVMDSARILMEGTPREVFARADELTKAGLDVPQVTRVLMRLRERGIDIGADAYTTEQAAALIRAKKEGKTC